MDPGVELSESFHARFRLPSQSQKQFDVVGLTLLQRVLHLEVKLQPSLPPGPC